MSPPPRKSQRRVSQLVPFAGTRWDTSGEPATSIEVKPYSLEARAVADYCVRSMPDDLEIVAIERVESLKPYQQYETQRQSLMETLYAEDPNAVTGMEVWLWHGTQEGKIKDIVQSGFPPPPAPGQPGAMFSVDPRSAFCQAQSRTHTAHDEITLLLARVAVCRAGESDDGDRPGVHMAIESVVSANGCEISVLGNDRANLAYCIRCKCPSLVNGLDSDPLWRLDEGRDMLTVDFKAHGRGRRGGLQLELVKRNEELVAQIDALEAGMELKNQSHGQRGRSTIMQNGVPAFARRLSGGKDNDDSDSDPEAVDLNDDEKGVMWHTTTHRNVVGAGPRGSLLKTDAPHTLSDGMRMVLVNALRDGDHDAAVDALTLPPGQTGLSLEMRLDDLGPDGAARLAEALPTNMQHLELGLTGCSLGNHGAKTLAKHIPARLVRLDLGLEFCGIGDEGMLAIARRLPRTLVHLELGLIGDRIRPRGAKSLADNLPREMVHLRLGLTGCCIGPEGAGYISSKIPASLVHLDLDFSNCRIGPSGAALLAANLPPGVVHLQLDLFNCRIGDEGATELGCQFPAALVYLHMSFIGNGITHKGIRGLCDGLPETLVYLHLCLTGNPIKDDGAHAVAQCLPEDDLVHLRLNFMGCGITEEGSEALREAVSTREGLATKEILLD